MPGWRAAAPGLVIVEASAVSEEGRITPGDLANLPCEGVDHMPEGDPRGWPTLAPSAIPLATNCRRSRRRWTKADILGVQQDFFAAAEPARDAGFEWLVLHLAHGYLAQSPPADAGLRD